MTPLQRFCIIPIRIGFSCSSSGTDFACDAGNQGFAGKPPEQRSWEGYSPRGRKESNTTAHTEASWNNPAVTGTRAVLEIYFLHLPPLRLDSSHS